MKRPSFKQRFRYWFDNRMSRGTASMIKMLAIATLALILFVAAAVTVFGLTEEGDFSGSLWDSFASTINAWVFYSDDGSLGYVALMAVAAVAGLFVTSILIGIIGSGIEQKLDSLRHGNSLVLESGHIVILGFNSELYRIVGELCTAAANRKKTVIVVMDSEGKVTMEDALREHIDPPRGVKIIFRSGSIFSPAALACCSLPTARTVIINAPCDAVAVKTALAVSCALRGAQNPPRVVTCITAERSVVPARIAGEGRIDVLHVDDIISRLVAHTCRQAGISEVVTDFFSFSGDELYIEEFPQLTGRSFADAALSFKRTLVLGIFRQGKGILNPNPETLLLEGDRLLVLARDNGVSELLAAPAAPDRSAFVPPSEEPRACRRRILVFGCNDKLEAIAGELAASCAAGSSVCVEGVDDGQARELRDIAAALDGRLRIRAKKLELDDADALDETELEGADHVIILSDQRKNDEDADADALVLLLRLREIKKRRGLSFYITTEMRSADNQRLAENDDVSDFIVSADIAGLIVAQIAENHELLPIFAELLSNSGSELYMRDADDFVTAGAQVSVATLIAAASARNSVFIGYKKRGAHAPTVINPGIDELVRLDAGDRIIVISEK